MKPLRAITGTAIIALTILCIGGGSRPAPAPKKRAGSVTYSKDIAPILYQHCTPCHHAGEVAPFALMTYHDTQPRAQTLAAVTQSRYMPPWKADSHGEFVGERRLTDQEIGLIKQWAEAGAPEGDPHLLPPTPQYPKGWHLGEPDVVLKPDAAYTLGAEGPDEYHCFVLPTNFSEDRWLNGIEVRPGNRQVVHHVLVFLDNSGKARELDSKSTDRPGYSSFGGPGFTPSGLVGAWVPGLDVRKTHPGEGVLLPKGSDIVMQVHYHRSGKSETDQTQIGLYFSKTPVDKQVRTLPVVDPLLYIAPGDAHYRVETSFTVPTDITVTDVTPHMHLLGHDMTVTATLPDGTKKQMVKVTDWDFNWQTRYTYSKPLPLPKGTKIDVVADYDNSSSNPRNPSSPPKTVTFGEQTTDEMCFAFVTYTADSEHITQGIKAQDAPEFGKDTMRIVAQQIFTQADKNGDGALDAQELTALIAFFQKVSAARGQKGGMFQTTPPEQLAKQTMAAFDADKDGKLELSEFQAMFRMMRGRD